jgi:hypothetical protein
MAKGKRRNADGHVHEGGRATELLRVQYPLLWFVWLRICIVLLKTCLEVVWISEAHGDT